MQTIEIHISDTLLQRLPTDAVKLHLQAELQRLEARAANTLFSDNAVLFGAAPSDLSENHDDYLYAEKLTKLFTTVHCERSEAISAKG
jgi:hypothetical protein